MVNQIYNCAASVTRKQITQVVSYLFLARGNNDNNFKIKSAGRTVVLVRFALFDWNLASFVGVISMNHDEF